VAWSSEVMARRERFELLPPIRSPGSTIEIIEARYHKMRVRTASPPYDRIVLRLLALLIVAFFSRSKCSLALGGCDEPNWLLG
jgi:hypothetical protein